MDYSFVKKIVSSSLTDIDLIEARRQAVPGSHTDVILKESLLDRMYDKQGLRKRISEITASGEFILNSFPCENFRGANLLLRSEFLILQYVGNGCLTTDLLDDYIRHTIERIRGFSASRIMYRCCDYHRHDFSFFTSDFFANQHSALARGAQLLVDEEELFLLDMKIVQGLLDWGIPVDILIPFVQFPDQLTALRDRAESFISYNGINSKFGMMLEVPANLFQISDYSVSDFFVFGPSDLTKYLYGGIDRNDWNYGSISDDVILAPIVHAIEEINCLQNRQVLLAKQLLNLEERLDYQQRESLKFRKLFMPNQIARPITQSSTSSQGAYEVHT
ncbi:MAG: hypothetical protein OEZ43_15460 [Gammaproteobacteria bacterium]|nr:hypothetical protein [Gammaproteobacteria bacterium]